MANHPILSRYALAAVIYALALIVCFHAVLVHPGSRVIGGFTDATGTLRNYWAAAVQHRNPFTLTHDALLGAPQGTATAPATVLANGGIQAAFVWELRGPLGLIGAWNAFMLIGCFATALAMFALLDRLGCSYGAALLGGYIFAFCPYALERAYAGHLAFLQNWVFVLLAAALLKLRTARSLRYAVAAGLAIAVAFYQTAYMGLFAAFMALVFLVVEGVRLGGWRRRSGTVVLGVAIFTACFAALTPLFVLDADEHTQVVQATSYGTYELYVFSAKIGAYALPSPRNPLFHWLAHIHPADLTEETLFVGYVTFVLALAALFLALRREGWFNRRELRATVVFLAAVAVVAFLWSLSPSYTFDGVTIPMPSKTTEILASTYRVYSRFGILFDFAVTALAAFALSALTARGGRWRLVTPVAAVLIVLELLPGNVPALNATAAPTWVAWLASQPRGIVATYPWLFGDVLGQDMWYQTLDRDPQFDVTVSARQYDPAQRDEGIRLLARDLFSPLTAQVLSTEGVRYVVVHDDVYRAAGYKHPPVLAKSDYTLLERFGNVRIFSVHAPKVNITKALRANIGILDQLQGLDVEPTITYGAGFNAPEQYQGNLSRWMIQNGRLTFDNVAGPMKVTLSGEAFANQATRVLELRTAAGRVVSRATIPTDAVPLELGPFDVPTGVSSFTLTASPGPETLGPTDPRQASVFLEPFVMFVMPTYIPGPCPAPNGATGAC